MILNSPTEEIRAYLGGAVAATEPEFFSSYTDVNDQDSAAIFEPKNLSGVLAGATPVVVVGSPAADVQRQVRYLSVYNLDSALVVVNIEKRDGADRVPLFRATLLTDEVLIYQTDVGWTLYNSSGTPSPGIVSPLTTKGDLWGYDTADNRFPVGADDEILVADSTQALGVKWTDEIPRRPLASVVVNAGLSPYAVLDADDVILADASAGPVTVALPAVASSDGRVLYVKKTDASGNAVSADGNAAELVDGLATFDLLVQYESVTLFCDGSQWWSL